MLRYRHFASLI